MLGNMNSFLTYSGDKIKGGSFIQNLLDAVLLLAVLPIKGSGHSRLNSLETKNIHSSKLIAKTLSWFKRMFSQMITWKN